MAIVKIELLDSTHARNERRQILSTLQVKIIVGKIECGYGANMMLERFHDDTWFSWLQTVIHEYDREDGESIPLDSLSYRVGRLSGRQILISKVNDWVLSVFNQ